VTLVTLAVSDAGWGALLSWAMWTLKSVWPTSF
jgi:hypothetical protein